MKKLRFNSAVFLITLFFVLLVSFTSAFLAFGQGEMEFISLGVKEIAYQVFLVLRFPGQTIVFVKSIFPQIHQQLIFSSVFYALLLTLAASNLRILRPSTKF